MNVNSESIRKHVRKGALLGFLCCLVVLAPAIASESEELLSQFKTIFTVPAYDGPAPQVVEVGLADHPSQPTFAIVGDDVPEKFLGYTYIPPTLDNKVESVPVSVETVGGDGENLFDTSQDTTVFFDAVSGQTTTSEIIVRYSEPITVSRFHMWFADERPHQNFLEIRVGDGQTERSIEPGSVSTNNVGTRMLFNPSRGSVWVIRFTHTEPIELSKIILDDTGFVNSFNSDSKLRFLAQPGVTYTVYVDPDMPVLVPTQESANFARTQADQIVDVSQSMVPNPTYRLPDTDGDGVIDAEDNCSVPNPNQEDVDGNGRGDQCDDFDHDGIANHKDNCPDHANSRQDDIDGDSLGDACDDEESRLLEKNEWILWVAIVVVLTVVGGLLALTLRHQHKENV